MVDRIPSDKPHTTAIIAVAICALVIRLGFLVASSDSLNADPDAYRSIAENLRQNNIFGSTSAPTAFRPPLYPILLAGLTVRGEVTPPIVIGLHTVFGVGTVVLTFLLAFRWRLGRWSFVAAAIVAIDPILLNQSAHVMTETFATLLATAGLMSLMWWSENRSVQRAIVAGVVLGLACLCRPTFLPWLGLSAGLMCFQQWTKRDADNALSLRETLGSSLAFVLAAIVVVSPWVIRNYAVFGVPKVTTTHGGYTILLGNNPSFYHYLRDAPRGTTWDSQELANAWQRREFSNSPDDPLWSLGPTDLQSDHLTRVTRNEFEDDEFAYSLARRYISDEPRMFVWSCVVRVSRLWQILPYRTNEQESTARRLLRYATGCWYGVLFVLAIVVFRSAKKTRSFAERTTTMINSPLAWGLLLCFTFTCVHALYWSNMRMRAPLMPFVCLITTQGAALIGRRAGNRKP